MCPDIGYKVFSLTEKPKSAEDENGLFQVENVRTDLRVGFDKTVPQTASSARQVPTKINTLINMLCATGKPLHTKIEEVVKDKLYKAGDEVYLLGEVSAEELESYKELKINIDGWSDISLENWLNLGGQTKRKM